MWRYAAYSEARKAPAPNEEPTDVRASERANELLAGVGASGRHLLTEFEAKQLLACYGIPVVQTELARDDDAAVALAEQIGYPVVLKLHSYRITHKSDVGGVQLDLYTADAVRGAFNSIKERVTATGKPDDFQGITVQPMLSSGGYELIVGARRDPQFGPVILFGKGGSLVELYKDQALALTPLSVEAAKEMIGRTIISQALHGVRGEAAADIEGLITVLTRFATLVVEHPSIDELEINPLLVRPGGGIHALDARGAIRSSLPLPVDE